MLLTGACTDGSAATRIFAGSTIVLHLHDAAVDIREHTLQAVRRAQQVRIERGVEAEERRERRAGARRLRQARVVVQAQVLLEPDLCAPPPAGHHVRRLQFVRRPPQAGHLELQAATLR